MAVGDLLAIGSALAAVVKWWLRRDERLADAPERERKKRKGRLIRRFRKTTPYRNAKRAGMDDIFSLDTIRKDRRGVISIGISAPK